MQCQVTFNLCDRARQPVSLCVRWPFIIFIHSYLNDCCCPLLQCIPPLVVATGIDERTLKREGVCAASLATTMGVVAGMLAQNALKCVLVLVLDCLSFLCLLVLLLCRLLLGFGTVSRFVGYNALLDYFPSMTLAPSATCDSHMCRQRQREYTERRQQELAAAAAAAPTVDAVNSAPTHESNEWGTSLMTPLYTCADVCVSVCLYVRAGIELVSGFDGASVSDAQEDALRAAGVRFAAARVAPSTVADTDTATTDADTTDQSLDDLQAQLAALSGK